MKWPSTSIGQLCLPTEQCDPTASPDKPFRYIDISAIDKDAKRITSAPELLGAQAPSRARKAVRAGDVLVSTVRPNLNAVAVVPDDLDGQIASTGFCVLRANPKLVAGKFIFYRCLTQEFINALVAQMRGANYPAVSDGVVKRAGTPAPAPKEQQRIVDLLDQADVLRQKRKDADTLAERILPALFREMFGDPAGNPRAWQKANLGSVIADASYGTSAPSNNGGDGLPVLRMNNIDSAGRIDLASLKNVALDQAEADRQHLRAGDLLFNRTNSKELVGKTGLWRGHMPAVAASYLIRLRVDETKVVPDYVWAWMNTPYFKQLLFAISRRAVGMANINATELRSMPILIPDLPRQRSFARRLHTLEDLATKRHESAQSLETLFSVILHRAFTGELTAKWREAHMKELLAEMEHQARLLNLRSPERN